MKYTVEIDSIYDFPAWSGGRQTLDDVSAAGKEYIDELTSLAEEMFADNETVTDTDINDWLWFDRDKIYEYIGLDENGEIPKDDAEDDNEDEEDNEEEEK